MHWRVTAASQQTVASFAALRKTHDKRCKRSVNLANGDQEEQIGQDDRIIEVLGLWSERLVG